MEKYERTNKDGSKVTYELDKVKKQITITFRDGSKKTYKASVVENLNAPEIKKIS